MRSLLPNADSLPVQESGPALSFETSKFAKKYSQPDTIPHFQHQLMAAVHDFINAYLLVHYF